MSDGLPEGYPDVIKARCPEHGPQPFAWMDFGSWWLCPGFFKDETNELNCGAHIPSEKFALDGGDVYVYDRANKIGETDSFSVKVS